MRPRIQAEQSLRRYTRKYNPQTITAALGTNAGTVDHPTRGDGWVYARLHGDPNQIVVVREEGAVPHVANLVVELELVAKTASSYYRVKGLASGVVYSTNTWSNTVGPHGWTHERKSGVTGGTDPVDVYARMVVPLRAIPQATPNLTMSVAAGFNPLTGNYYTGGNSGAVVVPTTPAAARYDLLYLGEDDALHWLSGAQSIGTTPTYPSAPIPSVPLAYVYLAVGQTTIEEHDVHFDPGVLRSAVGVSAVGSAHDVLSATHLDSEPAAVVEDDLIVANYSPTVFSPVWARLPKGADSEVLTVHPTTHHVDWYSPQSILTVMEIDGSPSIYPVNTIKVTNGTLTDSGGGVATLSLSGAGQYSTINFIIDGGGSAITTGVKGDIVVDFACSIVAWTLLADTSGAIKIDIWKEEYADFAPTDADTITNAHEPEIAASGIKAQDTDLSDWIANPPTIAAGDCLRFNVDSCTSITRATLAIKVLRT